MNLAICANRSGQSLALQDAQHYLELFQSHVGFLRGTCIYLTDFLKGDSSVVVHKFWEEESNLL
jgi:hypothetical protein